MTTKPAEPPPKLLGRAACPLCPSQAAHVKQRQGKLPYVHCPECGSNLATRNGMQAGFLLAKMRPELHAAVQGNGAPAPGLPRRPDDINISPPAPPAPAPAPAPAPKRSSWAPLLGAVK